MEQIQIFKLFSIALTGVSDLKDNQVTKYKELLYQKYPTIINPLISEVEEILNSGKELEKEIIERLLQNKEYKELIKTIIVLWYTGVFDSKLQSEDYYNSLIWNVIHAHPLGLTGGYYGYWKYKPEN